MIERTFIQQNWKKIELENFLKGNMPRSGFTKLDVIKTPMVTRLIVNCTHPGMAIGKGGTNIRRLTLEVGERFKIENPQIEIKEITTPDLDAAAVVDKMKNLLERGFSWRSVVYKIMRDIMRQGAQGVEIVLSGALGGKGERKRRQRVAEGYMKKTGDQTKLVDYAKVTCYPKYGAIGIKVRIVHPDTVFPDKINIGQLVDEKMKAREPAPAEEKQEAKAEEKVEVEGKVSPAVSQKAAAELFSPTFSQKAEVKEEKKDSEEEKKPERKPHANKEKKEETK